MSESVTLPAEERPSLKTLLAHRRIRLMLGFSFRLCLLGAVICFGSALISTVAKAASAQPAPRIFASDNYGVTFPVPPGLFMCPYPSSWVGSDHGTNLYLTKAIDCDPDGGEAAPGTQPLLRIQVFYAYNVAEFLQADGTTRAPQTNQELMVRQCGSSLGSLPAGLRLLGAAAVGCLKTEGQNVSLTIGSLYSEYPESSPQPDAMLILSLDTTRDRYGHDLNLFRQIAASVTTCTITEEPLHPPRQRCPQSRWW